MKDQKLGKSENPPLRVWETPNISATMTVQKVNGATVARGVNEENENYFIPS